jgi:arsenate reductase
MAAGFANHYGEDVLVAASAGLMPVPTVDSRTVEVMAERGIDVSGHVPSLFDPFAARECDIVVNLSGAGLRDGLPGPRYSLVEWPVKDPYRADIEIYREVRDEIERLVMLLILDLRRLRRMVAV